MDKQEEKGTKIESMLVYGRGLKFFIQYIPTWYKTHLKKGSLTVLRIFFVVVVSTLVPLRLDEVEIEMTTSIT